MISKHQHLSWKYEKKFNKTLIEWLWLFYNETNEKIRKLLYTTVTVKSFQFPSSLNKKKVNRNKHPNLSWCKRMLFSQRHREVSSEILNLIILIFFFQNKLSTLYHEKEFIKWLKKNHFKNIHYFGIIYIQSILIKSTLNQ